MVEIIDFFWPNDPDKTLFVCNIVISEDEEVVIQDLHSLFSEYGLVCEVKLVLKDFDCFDFTEINGSYALIKFYSKRSALKAFQHAIFYKESPLKVKLSNRALTSQPKPLYYKKCFELANHLLGFNGWSCRLTKCQTRGDVTKGQVTSMCEVCVHVRQGSVESRGSASAVEQYQSQVMASKMQAHTKAKNQAYRLAMEAAFSALHVVVLCQSGKVLVHCNGGGASSAQVGNSEEDGNLLQVNTCEEYAEDEEEEEEEEEKDDDDASFQGTTLTSREAFPA